MARGKFVLAFLDRVVAMASRIVKVEALINRLGRGVAGAALR